MKQILGKFLSLLAIVWCWNSQLQASSYGKYINEVENQFVKEMAKYGFVCTRSGGSATYDVTRFSISFHVKGRGSIELAREKIIFISERYLEIINNHEKIRPYLREYPFPESGLSLSLYFEPSDNQEESGAIKGVQHTRSMVFYRGNEGGSFIDLFEETYEEALEKINNPNRVLVPKTQTVAVTSTKKRLGSLVTDLSQFTPGMVLEALGIKNVEGQKEIADDIGELIGGICDLHFGEEFLEQIAQAVDKDPNGAFIDYWDNGQIKARMFFKNGFAEGHIHGWYPDGETAFKGYYKNGERIGIQLARYPEEIGKGSDPLARVLEYDIKGRLHSRQKTSSSANRLLTYAEYEQGRLNGDVGYFTGKRGRDSCYGEWKFKNGKLIKRIRQCEVKD